MPSAEPARTPFLPWVQALRASAAASVAFLHIAHDGIVNGGDPRGWYTATVRFFPWDAGVDVFFVISGFVIVHASAPLFAAPGGPGVFLRRRLRRIIPLYWIMTTVFLLVAVLGRQTIHGDLGGPFYLTASYLFIPWPRPDGVLQPAYGLGWTLNYEMFFYLLFTPFLLLARRGAVIGAGIALCLLVAFAPFLAPLSPLLKFWTDPILIEFVFGMEIALLLAAGITLPRPARAALVVIGVVAFHAAAAAPGIRPLIYGLPAAGFVAAAALGMPRQRAARGVTRMESWLVRLGDASYAMYLVHPFVMRGFELLWRKFHAGNEWTGTIYVAAGLLTAQACALAINMTLERQLSTLWRRETGITA